MSEDFNDFLSSYSPPVQKLARKTQKLIFDNMPGVSEHVYPVMKVIRYGLLGNKMAGIVCYLVPMKDRINLGFNDGTSLPDPKGLLEGTGKNLRHVKLKKLEDLDNPALRALLEAQLKLTKKIL